MIKYNSNTINDWNFGDDNIIKVYRNNAVCYYKVITSGGTPEYKVCYAVVDDISKYSETEFEDVYDKATEKWYKLNNLNQYEEYGVYGSGRTICEGSTSRLPQGYTEVEYIRHSNDVRVQNVWSVPNDAVDGNIYTVDLLLDSTSQQGQSRYIGLFGWGSGHCQRTNRTAGDQTNAGYHCSDGWHLNDTIGNYYQEYDVKLRYRMTTSALTITNTQTSAVTTLDFTVNSGSATGGNFGVFSYTGSDSGAYQMRGNIYQIIIEGSDNTIKHQYIPCQRNSDSQYGLYDLIGEEFYYPTTITISGGDPVTPTDCVTTYEGKLTIDGDYEYEWNGSSWVNVGEVSGSSKTSDFKIGDIKERVTTSVSDGDYLLFSYYNKSDISKPENIMSYNPSNNYLSNLSGYGITSIDSTTIIDPSIWLLESTASANTFYIKSIKNNLYWGYQSKDSSRSLNLVDSSSSQKVPVLITPSCKENCYGFVEKKSNASTGYGGYGLNQLFSYTYQLNWWNDFSSSDPCTFFTTDGNGDFIIYKMNANDAEYPKYYSDKSEPLDSLTFNTLAEAQTYAYNNCVYDGMHATIDGDRYYFNSEDENGWVKILEYYKVEDVTPNQASGWTISGSDTYNPDSSYYDDFDLETNWTSNSYKIAKVTIYGYDHFTYYLRSYSYSSPYGYIYATNVDEIQTPLASMSYNSSPAITNTYYWNKSPKSDVNLSNYRRVTYNNLDKTVEHTFYVYFYGRTYRSYVGNATILIPKEQTNENWEQVTFSASSNVALNQKSLYIDNNNSTSGGTNVWYRRWIVGLPIGSHSSYTDYSNYAYCPNVTSSTFTSVAGEQRQVNFTYDSTTDKTLSFRLTDGSNVLTPSDTVYYSMMLYNSCNVSYNDTNLIFPKTQSVKVGGSFSFSNSSNRHYIYGYQPPTLGTRYYVDNYQSTFDITYTKLSEEAVTVTYTTYDPNDSETPAFNTDITYPYNGGTTSSTTLTSYAVPYTYPYEVSQTNAKFSADSQSYTANQAARTISFTLYPNNREFASVSDLEAYQYAWEGMKATVGDTKYKYENGEWVENQHSLPDVPFTVNYNAKQYNASTKTLLKTEGQLADVDAVITAGTPTVHDGYLTIASSTRATISGYQNYFNRDNNNPNLTIISKQRTDGSNCHMFANRDSNYNWMYRCYSNKLTLHGSGEQGQVAVTTQPVIESVRIDSNKLATYNNYTDNTTSTKSGFSYGNINSTATALFAGYAQSAGEWFVGDFYWVYMCQGTLTDEQVQQVIDYNENL